MSRFLSIIGSIMLKLSAAFAAAAVVFGLVQAPAFAANASVSKDALNGCYAEANWSVEASPAYVYGNGRQRAQLRTSFHKDVYAMRRLCFDMTKADAEKASLASACGDRVSAELKVYGDKAREHAVRQRSYCEALSGQAVSVVGL